MIRKHPIAVIVCCILLATSLWFTPNSMPELLYQLWPKAPHPIATLTAAIQFGFVIGTLAMACLGLADRFAPHLIFWLSAWFGAVTNLAFVYAAPTIEWAALWRFLTGFALAGVYPLGMKLVVVWRPEKKQMVLSWLVGALTLGTALPHLLRGLIPQQAGFAVLMLASLLAVLAGFIIFWLGTPQLEQKVTVQRLHLNHLRAPLSSRKYRLATASYWGHMWELYAFWALVPLLLKDVVAADNLTWSCFAVIGIGCFGCVCGGFLARRFSSYQVAQLALGGSALCCAAFPLFAASFPDLRFILLLVWGVFVVADSPQFSSLVAASLDVSKLGAGFALQNATGFALTILAIQWSQQQWSTLGARVSWLLLPGPLLGLLALWRYARQELRFSKKLIA